MRFTKTFFIVALLALVAVPAAFALRFTDASLTPPNGETGKSYSFQLDGAGGCGPGLPYQFSILSGALPPGLSLAKRGLISGTPTQGGAYSFWVELSDENPPSGPGAFQATHSASSRSPSSPDCRSSRTR